MTERTFRTPSPSRPGSRDTNMQQAPPPVPPLPKNYANRRAASLEPTMRVTSPTPPVPGGRGFSLDRGPAPKTRQPKPKTKAKVQEDGGNENRNSVNFSYPTHARPSSPPVNALPISPTAKPKPGSAPANDAAVQLSVTQAANRPVKKKKKKVAQGSAEGSHLAAGGMGGKPHGVEVEKEQPTRTNKPMKRATRPSTDSESDSTPEKAEKRAQRASGQLNKQPSIVQEDWEGEQVADVSLSPVSTPSPVVREKQPKPNGIKNVNVDPTPIKSPENHKSLQDEHLAISIEDPKSRYSISPSRSTRFSSQLASELLGERKHEPPPRSLSPAKSALKHHSPSSRTHSPIDGAMPGGWRRSSQTPSEASDTTSLASAEGSKKKRAMHVSFNAEPSVVANGADKSRSQHLDTIEAEDDMEEVMKPRPALPSFGSIRNKKEQPDVRPIRSSKTSISSSASSSESYLPPTMEASVSSDHAIGAILAQDYPKKPAPTQVVAVEHDLPLPPEVTSVEGTGYHSDTDVSTYSNDDFTLGESPPRRLSTDAAVTSDSKAKDLTIDTNTASPAQVIVEEVPKIAVQPATPALEADSGLEINPAQDEWLVNVPGGFPESRDVSQHSSSRHVDQKETNTGATTPAEVGIAEPKPVESAIAQTSSTASDVITQSLLNKPAADSDADSTTGDSIYSDAAEDVAELEGDGFGSINAIVESPTTKDRPDLTLNPLTGPDVPSPSRMASERQDSWDETQAHWAELAERQRQSARSPPPDQSSSPINSSSPLRPSQLPQSPSPILEPQVVQKKPKKKKKKVAAAPVAATPIEIRQPELDSPVRAYPITSPYPIMGTESENAPNHATIRQSMRSPPPRPDERSSMPQSMRPPPRSALRQSKAAPAPKPSPNAEPRGALQKKSIPTTSRTTSKNVAAGAASSAAKPKPKAQPVPNDSDSESSFRRERRPKVTNDKYTMRRSMRSPPPESGRPQSAVVPVNRPVSPQARRPFSAGGQGALRSTMRSSTDLGAPSLRGSKQRPASISSFGKGAKISNTPVPPAALTSRFKSRFSADSDDEDVPKVFHSRFEDSSDDEPEPLNLRPVRGIPRKTDEEDSTDLDDSSDEEAKAKKSKVQISSPKGDVSETPGIRRLSSESGRDLTKASDVPSPKKGIFGRFRSKKSKDDSSRVAKSTAESPARRDTHLEQSQAELRNGRNELDPAKGKLQRRTLPSRLASDSWPLPEKADDDRRPKTSDGTAKDGIESAQGPAESRPGLGPREYTASTLKSEGGTPIYGRSGKKKRFPMLRKAFRLHD